MAAQPVTTRQLASGEFAGETDMTSPRFDRLCDRGEPPRRCIGQARDAAIVESVELTPGGRRKHTLQRTSPGGTTRTSMYISPNKADVEAIVGPDDGDPFYNQLGGYDRMFQHEMGMEQYRRRGVAVEEVACQQSDAQRSAVARSKRKAKVLPAQHQQVKRACSAPAPGNACDIGKLSSALFG